MAELQHFVPRFVLRNFARGKTPQLYVYDKSTDRRFRSNVRGVAAEAGFYDLKLDSGVTLTIEPSLAELETGAAASLRKITDNRSLAGLTIDDYHTLARFLAAQFFRTKESRLRTEHLRDLMREKMRRMGASEDEIRRSTSSDPSAPFDMERAAALNFAEAIQRFAPLFLYKGWVLYETSRDCPFYTSDNPVVLHNHIDHSPYGNLGLAVPGIEIYFPLSSTLCLCLMCPTIATEFSKGYKSFQLADERAPGSADSRLKNPGLARAICEGVVHGTAVPIAKENVTMANSLQVLFSTRFVYCELDAFELVVEMIRDNPKRRSALRPTVD